MSCKGGTRAYAIRCYSQRRVFAVPALPSCQAVWHFPIGLSFIWAFIINEKNIESKTISNDPDGTEQKSWCARRNKNVPSPCTMKDTSIEPVSSGCSPVFPTPIQKKRSLIETGDLFTCSPEENRSKKRAFGNTAKEEILYAALSLFSQSWR